MSKAELSADQAYDDVSLESLGTHLLFGDINVDTSRAACEFIIKNNLFKADTTPLTLVVNTVGGETTDGFALIDIMETSRLPIATTGVGTVSSTGLLITSAGTHGMRSIAKNSEIMAHQFTGYFEGKQHELIAVTSAFEDLEQRFVKHFLRHSNLSEKKIRDILFAKSDRYLSPQECKKFGLCDHVVDFVELPKIKKSSKQ